MKTRPERTAETVGMNLSFLFGKTKRGTTYLEALEAMQRLLQSQNQTHWRNWILQDIDEWNGSNSVSHHLSAYGGMGSFNDVGFENPWIGYLFDDLKSVCYFLAQHPGHNADASSIGTSMGNLGFDLQGWRCLTCGYGTVSNYDIERFIARRIIREEILKFLGSGHLEEFVETVIHGSLSHKILTADSVAILAQNSGIEVRREKGWVRPCPKCNSDDTAVYRWNLIENGDYHFESSADNLPLRKKV
jgi:hypothetical protein